MSLQSGLEPPRWENAVCDSSWYKENITEGRSMQSCCTREYSKHAPTNCPRSLWISLTCLFHRLKFLHVYHKSTHTKKISDTCLNDYHLVALTYSYKVLKKGAHDLKMTLKNTYHQNCINSNMLVEGTVPLWMKSKHLAPSHLDNKDVFVRELFIDFSPPSSPRN